MAHALELDHFDAPERHCEQPRDETGEARPTMQRTGRSSAARLARGVGSWMSGAAQPRTFATDAAIGALRASGV